MITALAIAIYGLVYGTVAGMIAYVGYTLWLECKPEPRKRNRKLTQAEKTQRLVEAARMSGGIIE